MHSAPSALHDHAPAPATPPHERPFLKWAGGKFRLLPRIFAALPPAQRLVEPFTGSAVVALNAPHGRVLAADANRDLITLYQAVQRAPVKMIQAVEALFTPANNTAEAFNRLRDEFNAAPPGERRAALFVYLNRHGFNGLCRYNAGGGFNVPFGRYAAPRPPVAAMHAFARRAAHVEFGCLGFEESFARAVPGDVIYCDPPYVPLSATASFTSYARQAFGPAEQERLADLARAAAARGVPVVISNHDTPEVRTLYRGAQLQAFAVDRRISSKASTRGEARELLALFRPPA